MLYETLDILTALALTPALCADAGTWHCEHLQIVMETPCATEDSVDCHWNAGAMGYGWGESFMAFDVGEGVTLIVYENGYYTAKGLPNHLPEW